MIEFLSQPWHWAISGLFIFLNMVILLWLGRRFGISSSLETLCTIGGAGKRIQYFAKDWRDRAWLLFFVFGSILGGWLAVNFLASPEAVAISQGTMEHLNSLGIESPQSSYVISGFAPSSIFSFESLSTFTGVFIMIFGGFLIGLGARYAGGCTSGHAISGISNIQLPSFIAVLGFFIGGLLSTHYIIPWIL